MSFTRGGAGGALGSAIARATVGLMLAVVAGCASSSAPLALTAEEWSRAVAAHGIEEGRAPHPVKPTPEMEAVAMRVAGEGSDIERLERLQAFLFDPSEFLFDYSARTTLTAAEAFARRVGNCVSFTNMFIAMGRSLGLPVVAALAEIPRETETLGSLVLVNSHVVALLRHDQRRAVFDFDQQRERTPLGYVPISDLHLTAIYLNNKGAERLIAGHPELAIQYFADASRLAPGLAATYTNLGVAYQRIGDLTAALDSYLLALRYEPRDLSTRNNLQGLFALTARARRSAKANGGPASSTEIDRLLADGDEALSTGRTERARELYNEARKLDATHPEPYVSLARILLFKGRVGRAEARLEKALVLDRDHVEANRLLRGLGGSPPKR